MGWIADEILVGLVKLISLKLSFSPAPDSLQTTADTWIEVITPVLGNPVCQVDAPRLRAAFLILCRSCKKWPAPADLIENLPPRQSTEKLPEPKMSEEQRTDGLAHLAVIIKKLDDEVNLPW
jgi:hypothetical protein